MSNGKYPISNVSYSMSDFSKTVCVFPGRFQPFHTGQLMVVEGMVKLCGKVVIAICASEQHDTAENPFSWDERREMIQRALQEKDLIEADVAIVAVPDQENDAKWIDRVREIVGPFQAVWTGNEEVQQLCETHGIEVKAIKKVPGFDGEAILKMMRDDDGFWDEKVPGSVSAYVKSIDGKERVRNLG